jgi:uncharacterized small protein (DUF1192 family)
MLPQSHLRHAVVASPVETMSQQRPEVTELSSSSCAEAAQPSEAALQVSTADHERWRDEVERLKSELSSKSSAAEKEQQRSAVLQLEIDRLQATRALEAQRAYAAEANSKQQQETKERLKPVGSEAPLASVARIWAKLDSWIKNEKQFLGVQKEISWNLYSLLKLSSKTFRAFKSDFAFLLPSCFSHAGAVEYLA